jgi:WD40 repeat protein
VHVIDANTGKNLFVYAGHNDAVWSVAWSPDGTKLATGSDDHTVHIWQAPEK